MAHQDQPGTPGSFERDSLFKRLRAKPENKVRGWMMISREANANEKERPFAPAAAFDERTLAGPRFSHCAFRFFVGLPVFPALVSHPRELEQSLWSPACGCLKQKKEMTRPSDAARRESGLFNRFQARCASIASFLLSSTSASLLSLSPLSFDLLRPQESSSISPPSSSSKRLKIKNPKR